MSVKSARISNPKPFLRWAGSKRKLIPLLSRFWGYGYKRYMEPFMGSACLYFAVQPKCAILGDVNEDLIVTFKAVRNRAPSVYRALAAIPKGEKSFYRLRALDPKLLGAIERSARFIFLNRYCFNGLYRTNKSGQFNVPFCASKTGELPSLENLRVAAKQLKGAIIEHCDFEELVITNATEGDFVFLDPPYAVRNNRIFHQYGPDSFGINDLVRLRNLIDMIVNRGACFVLCYADCPEVRNVFDRWQMTEVKTQRNISGFSQHRQLASELVVSNIPLDLST